MLSVEKKTFEDNEPFDDSSFVEQWKKQEMNDKNSTRNNHNKKHEKKFNSFVVFENHKQKTMVVLYQTLRSLSLSLPPSSFWYSSKIP